MVTHSNIHEAKLAVMQEVEYVQKTGKMTQGANYKYVTVDEVIAKLRPKMIEHGIHFSPTRMELLSSEPYTTKHGSVMNHVVLGVAYRLSHASGTFEDGYAVGEGSDSGDKACNKAMTAAKKYALLQSFCLETGEDDPDHDPSADQERAAANGKPNGKPKSDNGSPTKMQEYNAKLVSLKAPQLVEKLASFDREPAKAAEHFGGKDEADVARAATVAQLYKKIDIDVGFQTTPKLFKEFQAWVTKNAFPFFSQMQQDTLAAKLERQSEVAHETART